jgi:hypothetical protein
VTALALAHFAAEDPINEDGLKAWLQRLTAAIRPITTSPAGEAGAHAAASEVTIKRSM